MMSMSIGRNRLRGFGALAVLQTIKFKRGENPAFFRSKRLAC